MKKLTNSVIAASRAAVAQAFANIAAIDALPAAPLATGDSIQPGKIYLANESVFTQAYFDEPLTNYAVGYKDPNNIEATLNFFAPATPVPRRFTYKTWTQVEEFLTDANDLRAIGGEFPTVKFTGTEVHGRTDNRGLRIRVDLDEVDSPDTMLGSLPAYQALVVEKLKRRLLRNSLTRAVALLAAGATGSSIKWTAGGGVSLDPDADVATAILAATTASGITPNKVGYGNSAWLNRWKNYRTQLTAGAISSADLDEVKLGDRLNADVLVSRERSSAAGASLAEVMGNLVLIFFTQGADIEDPSNVKRFVSSTESGGPIRVYVQQVSSKLVDITVEHYEKVAITSPLGLSKIPVT